MTGRVAAAGLEPATQELEEQLTGWNVPGLELAVVHGGEVAFAGGFGVRGVHDQSPVTATTLFQHGSCGKASTSLLAAARRPGASLHPGADTARPRRPGSRRVARLVTSDREQRAHGSLLSRR